MMQAFALGLIALSHQASRKLEIIETFRTALLSAKIYSSGPSIARPHKRTSWDKLKAADIERWGLG